METKIEQFLQGRRLEIISYGNPSHSPVLFFHGFGASATCLDPDPVVLDELRLWIIAPNRPGTGRSEFYHSLSMSTFLADIHTLLDQLHVGKVSLMGWSAGGVYAQAFGAAYPDRVSGLTLISSAIPFFNASSRRVLPVSWKIISLVNRYLPAVSRAIMAGTARKLARDPDKVMQESREKLPEADQRVLDSPRYYARYLQSARESFGTEGLGPYFDLLMLCSGERIALDRIHQPVSIWHGTDDSFWPMAFATYLAHEIPGSVLHPVEGKAHLLYLDEWDTIVKSFQVSR